MEYWKRVRESGVGDDLLILPGANVFIENDKGEILMHKGYEHDSWKNIGGLSKVMFHNMSLFFVFSYF